MKISRKRFYQYFFILFYSVVLINRIGKFENPYSQIMEAGFETIFICLVLVTHMKQIREKTLIETFAKKWVKLFFLMQFAIQVYSFLLALFNYTSIDLLSSNIYSFIYPLFVFSMVVCFKDDALKVFSASICTNFLLCFIINVLVCGPECIHDVILSNLEQSSIGLSGVFEVHRTSFAAGILFLYYFINKETDNRVFYLIVLGMAIFFGQKRIEFLAIIIVLLLIVFDKLYKYLFRTSSRYRMLEILMGGSILLCFLYVYISVGGGLKMILNNYGINMMGRDSFYRVISEYAYFSPSYLGIGRNAAGHIISNTFAGRFTVLHNDILKMYVECGFFGFFIWLYINLIYIPNRVKKYNSYKAALNVILIIIYLFICYLTDNCETYAVVQAGFMLIIIFSSINRDLRTEEVIK